MEPSHGSRILLIDDDPAYHRLTTVLVEGLGHTVISALGAEQGLRLAADAAPDLVLIDMHLPGTDGFQTIRRLRQDVPSLTVPVIALTAADVSGDADQAKARAAGFVAYATKPIRESEFRALLTTWVGHPEA